MHALIHFLAFCHRTNHSFCPPSLRFRFLSWYNQPRFMHAFDGCFTPYFVLLLPRILDYARLGCLYSWLFIIVQIISSLPLWWYQYQSIIFAFDIVHQVLIWPCSWWIPQCIFLLFVSADQLPSSAYSGWRPRSISFCPDIPLAPQLYVLFSCI